MSKLSKITDFEKDLLKAMGQTADQHQREILLTQQVRKAHSTKKEPTQRQLLNELNALFEKKREFKVPIRELAERVEEVAKPEPILLPQAYVLFIRHWNCTSCKRQGSCMDTTQIFLENKVQGKDESTRIFKPVEVLNLPLPHKEVFAFSSTPVCHFCFKENEKCKSQNQPSLLPPQTQKPTSSQEPNSVPTELVSPSHTFQEVMVGSASTLTEPSQSIPLGLDQPI